MDRANQLEISDNNKYNINNKLGIHSRSIFIPTTHIASGWCGPFLETSFWVHGEKELSVGLVRTNARLLMIEGMNVSVEYFL